MSVGRTILFASGNPHKVEEVRAILGEVGVEVMGLTEIPLTRREDAATSPPRGEGGRGGPPTRLEDSPPSPRGRGEGPKMSSVIFASELPEPEEDGETFEENAAIKARYYARATGMECLADDSGLEVDALGGAPGVRSARYAGAGGTRAERDAANNARLLRELEGVPEEDRAARFVCAMAMANPEGEVLATTRGTFEGRIGFALKGSNGFGYDPLLVVEDGRTSAELTSVEKNARSHRGEAARKLVELLA